ncbi:MAG: carbohydrate porin [Saprospiraceae bacterium]|nr:carbohydrate porin [Pyrinomonadaceae bacterium]
MYIYSRALIFVTVLAAFLSAGPTMYGQEPTPTPTPTSAAVPAAVPAAAPEWHEREELTGDWGGVRSRWKEKGVTLDFKLVLFAQGTAAGGIRRDVEGNGKFETDFKFDFGKLAGWQFWSAQLKTETRFGGPSLGGIGTLSPVNTAMLVPGLDGTDFSITALNVTKLIPIDLAKGNLVAVSVGRFKTLDLVMEDFFGGAGESRFFHIAQNGGIVAARQIPLVTNGGSIAWVRGGVPFITFAVLDPNEHSQDAGLDNLFSDGVSFIPGINFTSKYGGKSGLHTFGAAFSTKKTTPFDALRQVIIPGPPLVPIQPKKSWSVNYTFRQYLVERGPKDGWGLFTQVAFSNESTSPVTNFFMAGVGGNGLFKSRNRDEFGIVYSYSGLSDVLKDNINPFGLGGRLRAEHQFETFYNFYLTPWLRLTGDLQIIRPTRPIAETAIIPGARLEIIF